MAFGKSSDRKDTGAYTDSDPKDQMQQAMEKARKSRRMNIIVFVVIIAAFLVYNMFFRAKTITAAMDDQAFALVTYEDESIAFLLADVESVELGEPLSAFDRGTLQTGTETSTCCSGTYLNDAFGEYQLHVNLKVDSYVTVRYTDGILVFNTPTSGETEELYTKLLDAANR